MSSLLTVLQGDALARLRELEDESVHCCVTSPPYWGLRDYGVEGQIGLEATPEEFIHRLVLVFREVRRVLRADGTAWVNMGDCYAGGGNGGAGSFAKDGIRAAKAGTDKNVASREGSRGVTSKGKRLDPGPGNRPGGDSKVATLKAKDMVGQPWMLAFALRADGWYLRRDIIWHKPNAMPESCRDRPPTAHEYLFLLSKSERYYYDEAAVMEPVAGTAHARSAAAAEWPSGDVRDENRRRGGNPPVNGWADGPGSHHQIDHAMPGGSYKGSVPGRRDGPGQSRRSERPREGHLALSAEPEPAKPPHDSSEARKARAAEHQKRFPTNSHNGVRETRVRGHNEDYNNAISRGDLVEMRKKRSVWSIPTAGFPEAHFATYPPALVKPCILAGCPVGGTVLDPFGGSGTTGMVALELGRRAVLIELNPRYLELIARRCDVTPGLRL